MVDDRIHERAQEVKEVGGEAGQGKDRFRN